MLSAEFRLNYFDKKQICLSVMLTVSKMILFRIKVKACTLVMFIRIFQPIRGEYHSHITSDSQSEVGMAF